MPTLPESTLEIIDYLKSHTIDPILYGSQGVSLYLGNFKTFNDVDLLVAGNLLTDEWPHLQKIMIDDGFSLVDEHEHEFKNAAGTRVGFGDENILIRDGILNGFGELISIDIGGRLVRTLTPDDFKTAYEFSMKDGYRIETRGKRDSNIIARLEN